MVEVHENIIYGPERNRVSSLSRAPACDREKQSRTDPPSDIGRDGVAIYGKRVASSAVFSCLSTIGLNNRGLLDKNQLSKAASSAGLAVLPSWDPLNIDDLSRLAPSLPYPILIKPRTHVHRRRNDKGIVVDSRQDLIPQYRRFLARELDRDVDHAYVPDAKRPILQQFVRVGREGVHSVSGFIDRTGELFVTRRSRKVFQRMQPLGVGVCFKSLPNDPDLSLAIYRLCRDVGYFGIFEIEFIRFDGRWVAIDFNPRFYNQMAMDIRRGMPLPLLACLDASGDMSSLREIIETVQIEKKRPVLSSQMHSLFGRSCLRRR